MAVDDENGTIDLKIGLKNAEAPVEGLVESDPPPTKVLAQAVRALGERVVADGVTGRDAATALLLGLRPAGAGIGTGSLRRAGETLEDAAVRLVLALDGSYLPIQGPPGTGKTFTAARQILELVRAGPHRGHHRAVARGHRQPDRQGR